MMSSRIPTSWTGTMLLLCFLILFSTSGLYAQTPEKAPEELRTNGRSFKHQKRTNANNFSSLSNCGPGVFRSIDGTCNNDHPDRGEWGATDIALWRSMSAEYGGPDFLNDMAGQSRVTPRAISNRVIQQTEDIPSGANLSSFVFCWGQFIDHDFSLTPEGHGEYEPIVLPPNEIHFVDEIPFFRSEVLAGTGATTDREQFNLITSWIDGSNVYGSDQNRADWLRTFVDGKLKTSAGNLLPYNTIDGEKGSPLDPDAPSMAGDDGGVTEVFVAGDVRGVEQSSLTAMHTLFVREHNRICEELLGQGYNDDEMIYQIARKRVGAIIQAITYREFLPALGVYPRPYVGYRSNVRPDISNIFATAAYRLGHTMVPEELLLRDNRCDEVGPGSLTLIDAFFDLEPVETYGIDPILKGLSMQVQQEVDIHIVEELRSFLFAIPGTPAVFGLDLASLNIQRGRDHGLPDYNSIRRSFQGRAVSNFREINSDRDIYRPLRELYDNQLDNIDPWVGMLAERHVPGSSVGPTLQAILSSQFERLRDGDYFYYENDPFFTQRDRNTIRRTSLSDILRRNTEINNFQENVFVAEECSRMGPGGGGPGGPGGGGGRAADTDYSQWSTAALQIYPNPVEDQLEVQLTGIEAGAVDLQVYSIEGRLMHAQVIDNEVGYQSLAIEVDKWPTGMYIIRMQNEHISLSERFMVK